MAARQYLSQLKRLDILIRQKRREHDDLLILAVGTGGFDYSKDRVQVSPAADAAYTRAVERMIVLETEINAEIERYALLRHKIINQIQGLADVRFINILNKRYAEFKKFDMIADEMGYTYQYTVELHGAALQEFEKTYGI